MQSIQQITYEEASPGYIGAQMLIEAEEAGFHHRASGSWPFDGNIFDASRRIDRSFVRGKEREIVLDERTGFGDGGGFLHVNTSHGDLHVHVVARDQETAASLLKEAAERWPRSEPDPDSEDVQVTFWVSGRHGPSSLRRNLDAQTWNEVAENYPGVRTPLGAMMSPDWRPGAGGQLVLWNGPPGTGKTTALRALARQWKPWCDMHYIADPDKFFGSEADYMLQVMLAEDGDLPHHGDDEPPPPRWRLLVLEDTGELLQPDARRETGQALSRFLNVVDGMLGRGLRVLVLVTTNEEVGKLHPAVARPGRCAAQIEFPELTIQDAREWLSSHGSPDAAVGLTAPLTLAECYALLDERSLTEDRRPVGFAA